MNDGIARRMVNRGIYFSFGFLCGALPLGDVWAAVFGGCIFFVMLVADHYLEETE